MSSVTGAGRSDEPAPGRERTHIEAILEAAVDAVITIDEQGIIQSANPAVERLFGYPPADLIGRNVSMLMPSPHRERHDQYLAHYLRTGEAKVIGIGRELEALRRDGTTFPIELTLSEVRTGGRRLFTGFMRDISQRKQAEEALRESQARIQAILDTAVDGIITIDEQGIVEIANPAVERLFGYAPADLIGRNISMLMPSPHRERHDAYLARYLSTGEARVIGIGRELEGLRRDGTTFPLELALSEVRGDGRRRFTGIVRDITVRKQAEQALLRADALKDEFLANTSHELRTPLNGIIGIGQSMIDGATGPLSDAQRHNLAMVVASGRRLANLVNDLLDFSKLRHEKIELNCRPTDLHALADLVLTVSQALVGKRPLRVFNRIPPQVELAEADEDRVQQILFNLVGNALKFTPAGTVEVFAQARGRVAGGYGGRHRSRHRPRAARQRSSNPSPRAMARPTASRAAPALASPSPASCWNSMAEPSGWSPNPGSARGSPSPCRSAGPPAPWWRRRIGPTSRSARSWPTYGLPTRSSPPRPRRQLAPDTAFSWSTTSR